MKNFEFSLSLQLVWFFYLFGFCRKQLREPASCFFPYVLKVIRVVATEAARAFIDEFAFEMPVYTDLDEWSMWKKRGDPVLHIGKFFKYFLILIWDCYLFLSSLWIVSFSLVDYMGISLHLRHRSLIKKHQTSRIVEVAWAYSNYDARRLSHVLFS